MQRALCSAVVCILVSGCAVDPANLPSEQRSERARSASTAELCASYTRGTSDALGNQIIEAELVTRGVTTCSSRPIGTVSSRSFGRQLYDRNGGSSRTSADAGSSSTSNSDVDCDDFSSGAAAQRFFLATGGPFRDPNDLDRDGDGLACEWGAQVRQIASARISAPRSAAPRRTSFGRCYVGPRGGTYTITASGNRNYNGC